MSAEEALAMVVLYVFIDGIRVFFADVIEKNPYAKIVVVAMAAVWTWLALTI